MPRPAVSINKNKFIGRTCLPTGRLSVKMRSNIPTTSPPGTCLHTETRLRSNNMLIRITVAEECPDTLTLSG